MKKKFILIIILFLFNIKFVNAEERISVTLNKCVDGDTAWFNLNGNKIKTRFLAIDTPESTNKIEKYGKEASKFTCDLLTNSKKTEIKYDKNSDKTDKYDRHLVWVFVNNKLIQEEIIKQGLGETKYLYGDYEYTDILKKAEKDAQNKKIGIWSNYNSNLFTKENIILLISILIVIITYIFNAKYRRKINNKIINKAKKKIIKETKNIL